MELTGRFSIVTNSDRMVLYYLKNVYQKKTTTTKQFLPSLGTSQNKLNRKL